MRGVLFSICVSADLETVDKKVQKKSKKLLTKHFLFDIIYKSSRNSGDFAGMAQSVEHVIGND